MTLLRALLLALCTIWPSAAVAYDPHPASTALIEAIGLDNVFAQFGQTISTAPRASGIADQSFLAIWESAAPEAFGDQRLKARLQASLARTLRDDEVASVAAFLASPFGQRVTRLEQASQGMDTAAQLAALAKGQTLYWRLSEQRRVQFEGLLELSGAQLTFAVIGESLRGMALGLNLSSGDIETPWQEIDSAVRTELEGMKQSLTEAARAALAFTYADLTDAELEAYLAFLRTPEARNFYAAATLAVGAIIRDTMVELGESVARRMRRVSI